MKASSTNIFGNNKLGLEGLFSLGVCSGLSESGQSQSVIKLVSLFQASTSSHYLGSDSSKQHNKYLGGGVGDNMFLVLFCPL